VSIHLRQIDLLPGMIYSTRVRQLYFRSVILRGQRAIDDRAMNPVAPMRHERGGNQNGISQGA